MAPETHGDPTTDRDDWLARLAEALGSDDARRVAEVLPRRVWDDWAVERFRFWWVRATGMEVTQSIQHHQAHQHLTDPADRGADNSVRLVAGKTTWVRVYVRGGIFGTVHGVTGRLRVQRRILGFLWVDVATLSPLAPGTVRARPFLDYATERGNVAHTLNFRVPPETFWGNVRMTVTLTDGARREYDTRTVTVDATLRQTLRLRGILVSYNGPTTANATPGIPTPPPLNLAAPSLADLQATSARALRAMPVQAWGSFTQAGATLAWTRPLDDPRLNAGGCSANWNLLLNALTNRRTADGNRTDVVYYGLLPSGIPLGVPGCGIGGLGSAVSGDQGTLLHEIGHGYGFQHTPCGAAGATDPSYPTYEPYAPASIGEYGLDTSTGAVLVPGATSDYMSYCFPQWMSLYQHRRLIQHARLDPRWENDQPWLDTYREWRKYRVEEDLPYPPDPWRRADMRAQQVISVTGVVHPGGRPEVLTVARVAASTQLDGRRTGLTVSLRGRGGEVLAQAPLVRLTTHGGGCGCDDDDTSSYLFQAFVPDVEIGDALTIDGDAGELWVRHAPEEPAEVHHVTAEPGDDGSTNVRWEAHAGKEPEFWVQATQDGGRTWDAVATGVTGDGVVVDAGALPAGAVELRVLAHDGFTTAVSETVRVEVPARAPSVAIMHPVDDQTLPAGGALQLWAAVPGVDVGRDAEIRWVLDGHEVAAGEEAWVEAPEAGAHKLELLVRTGDGEAAAGVTFTTVAIEGGSEES